MLTFLNGENSDSYKMAVCLDDKLKLIGYGFNYYQILGLDINYTREELDENYKDLMDLMSNNNVLEEEKKLVIEAHRCFTSFLGSTWYEKDVGSYGRSNVSRQYEVSNNSKKMFSNLKKEIGNKVVVNYIEKKDNEFIENNIVGILANVDNFNDITICGLDNFDIELLGENSAIIKITDKSGKVLYSNEYLEDKSKRELYTFEKDVVDGFKIASWGFYNVRKLELEKNLKNVKNNTYVKKI